MVTSVLDGGRGDHRHPAEKEAGSSEEVALMGGDTQTTLKALESWLLTTSIQNVDISLVKVRDHDNDWGEDGGCSWTTEDKIIKDFNDQISDQLS